MSWTRPHRCFSLYAPVAGRLNVLFFFFLFFFFLSTNPPPALLLRVESSLICYLTVGSKQVHKQKENRFADPEKLTKKKLWFRIRLRDSEVTFGIFSSNDKQPSPSEELEESKEVQESKGKGIFFVGGQTGEDCRSLLDRRSQKSRSSLIEPVPSSFFGNISSAIFLSENAFLRNIRKQSKKKKEGKKSLEDLAVSVSPVIRKVRCQTSEDWSPMIAKLKLFEPETVIDIQRKEN